MKKTTLLFLIVASISFAQKQANRFEASADGFVDYIVLDFEGKTENEIFSQVQAWAQYNIRNAKHAKYSEVENEYVAYTLFLDKAFKVDAYYSIDYDLELRIKEGRLRIDLTINDMPLDPSTRGVGLTFSKGINSMFKKNGEPRTLKDRQLKREAIERFANDLVASINEAVSGKADTKEDW